MKVQIFGNSPEAKDLLGKVQTSLTDLGLAEFVEVESTTDEGLKAELNISKDPALVIVEPSIDFKDMIFEGLVPPEEELKSMFISIVGGESSGGCGTGCGTGEGASCGSGCGCH